MKTFVSLIAAAVSLAVAVAPAAAQSTDELRALRKDVERLSADLQEIKALLRGRAAAPAAAPAPPPNLVLTVDGDTVKGARDARLVLIEFTDYQCPFCARHFRDTAPQIQKEYVDTGRLRHVSREYPLETIHPQAFKASEAALCAGDQGRYWEMHDVLFANQRALAPAQLAGHAATLGLDVARFTQCLESGTKASKVRRDLADGGKAGVAGTPAFFLGVADGDTVKVVRVLKGAQGFAAFKEAIDGALAGLATHHAHDRN